MSEEAPDVSVVVPAYRAHSTLRRCLASLEAQDFPGRFEIIVVVSADREHELPSPAIAPGATWVRHTPRLPAAEARNLGAERARGHLLAFTDADVVVSPGWLRELLAAADGRFCVAGSVVNGTPLSPGGTVEYLVEFFDLNPARPSAPVHGATCNLLVPRDLWCRYGPFPTGMEGCEDTWLTARLDSDGWLRFAPAAFVAHLNREQLRHVIAHQYQLGQAHARLARMQEDVSSPVRYGLRATRARAGHFFRSARAWTPEAQPTIRRLTPLILAGFAAWGAGLIQELLAGGAASGPAGTLPGETNREADGRPSARARLRYVYERSITRTIHPWRRRAPEVRRVPEIAELVAPHAAPELSVCIPTRDRLDLLLPCLESLATTTRGVAIEVIIGDSGSLPDTVRLLRDLGLRVVPVPGRFNYSRVCNRMAAVAAAPRLLFLNNDTEAVSPGWAERLLAIDEPEISGALLIYPHSGRVQHAGVQPVRRAGWAPLNAYRPRPRLRGGESLALQNIALGRPVEEIAPTATEVMAVSGAFLSLTRERFQALGGFDEAFSVDLQDIDLCLRARAAGMRVVCRHDLVFRHRHAASRGRYAFPLEDWNLLLDRWRSDLARWESAAGAAETVH